MLHIVGYHNPDVMGCAVVDTIPFTLASNKKSIPESWLGQLMWVMTKHGTQKDKLYLLSSWYVIEKITPGDTFNWVISGVHGGELDPMPVLQDFDWFPSFLHWMGNFGRGVSELTLQDVIADLVQLAADAGCPVPSA